MPGVSNLIEEVGAQGGSVVGGDFRWLKETDEQLLQTERDLARQFWLRWRKVQRSKILSKKRSRR